MFVRFRTESGGFRRMAHHFGPPSDEKEVRVVNLGDQPTPVPATVITWTSTLITVEFDVRIDQLYDISVVVNGEVSNTLQISP